LRFEPEQNWQQARMPVVEPATEIPRTATAATVFDVGDSVNTHRIFFDHR